jgi:uncharacterized protein (DUF1015 family)
VGLNAETLVAPFVGERYSAGVPLSDLVAPPYDVIDEAGRAALAQRHAANVVHLILPQGDGDRYVRAAETLAEWRERGFLTPDSGPGLYVLQQRFTAPEGALRTRTGVIAGVVAEPFSEGRVRPHERTHAGPKRDRLELIRATRTMCEALLLLSRDPTGALQRGLAEITAEPPAAEAQMDGVGISLWYVSGDRALSLADGVGREPLYIADGHHRYETAVAYRRENALAHRTLGLIVPTGDPGLLVLPTHRMIGAVRAQGVPELLREVAAIDRLPPDEDVRQALAEVSLAGGGCVVAHPDGLYRMLRAPGLEPPSLRELLPVVRSLDVAWADTAVIPHLQSAAGALRYTPDLDLALRSVRDGEVGAAVLLNPPPVEQVLAVADAGAFMPPKATFFTPKVPSGLVFLRHSFSPSS